VALGAAAAIGGILLLIKIYGTWIELSDFKRAAGLMSAVFLIVLGIFAALRFGLDELQDLTRVLATQAELADALESVAKLQSDVETLARENRALRNTLEGLRSRMQVQAAETRTAPTQPAQTGAEQALRRILDKWFHDIPYTRDELKKGVQPVTEADWATAMAALEMAGYIGRGGNGGRQKIIVAPTEDRGEARAIMLENALPHVKG
jgi:regulator of replication initiation timing